MLASARRFAYLSVILLGAGISLGAQAASIGEQVAASKGCDVCHGSQGQGQPQAGFPRLAGQSATYLLSQLEAIESGERPNPVMQAQVRGLSKDDMRALAKYYASLSTPVAASSRVDDATLQAGREIVVNGLWQKNVPGCVTCHGPGARGMLVFPSLAGQGANYIEAQLKAWQSDRRPSGPDGIMAHVAKQLDGEQVHVVAAYLSSLPVSGPVPADMKADYAPATADAMPGYFQPPVLKDLPKDQFGDSVKRGYLIFTQTPKYAADYVGNGQSCSNCHTNAGRQANSAPMWAAWGMYPTYRSKNKKVNDMVMRLQGCFRYSENAPASKTGSYPAADSPVMIDLESYMYWMSQGVPTGKKMDGRGYPKLADPPQPFSRERGKAIYATNCAMCHGPNGQGHKLADGSYAFPPLWGRHAFNWGAGMHGVDKAASFIHHNMPYGFPGKLDLQQTWDVAAWIDSHPRPQDPRFNGDLQDTIKKFHRKRDVDFYGKEVDGHVLGAPGTLDAWQKKVK